MKWTPIFGNLADVDADWLIVGVWQDRPFDNALAQLDQRTGNLLTQLQESKDFTGKANEVTPVLSVSGLRARRLLLVGLGEIDKATLPSLLTAASAASRAISDKETTILAAVIPEPAGEINWQQMATIMAIGVARGCEGPGLRKTKPDRFLPQEIRLVAPRSAPQPNIRAAVETAAVEATAASLVRELVNTPPCDLYPETFAARAEAIAAAAGLRCTVFDEKQLAKERMGSMLGVAQGSDRPPRLVVLRYQGASSGNMLGLIGKGVTFDSGGLSLKPSESMLDMKCDMAGAAVVLAAMEAVASLKLPVNILGVLALVENMPSGKAVKLGDVLQARNGKTIEIHNTDAEGRLILADALAYAVDQKASHMVDLATLTGACMVALGTEVTGLMSNNDAWSAAVQAAAQRAGELVWPLPMFPLYTEMIKSNVADIKNTGGVRWAGAISAAKFLEEFVNGVPWVHLDIAGPAWVEHENATRAAGGTGAMVRTMIELARGYAA
jgi:leucyl aminopeptidase